MKGIYLGAYQANHPNYDIIYQDINGTRDIPGDMLSTDLSPYDFIIATPPCNWWSRANYRRDESIYSIKTKYLLPCILFKLILLGKPFIVENVRNEKKFKEYDLYKVENIYTYKIGRHTYWSNVLFRYDDIHQVPLTDYKDGKKRYLSSQNLDKKNRQGGEEVHQVIERFLEAIHESR